jgi:pimeloyl-ACP methyl ester carboxylesterase
MIETHVIEIDGIKTVSQITRASAGVDKAIVALHGWGADKSLMLPLAERLSPLGYDVYALDLPGFGESDAPPPSWFVYDYANWVTAYLDAMKLNHVYLIGHSFGGRLGLILGATVPERVDKMVLVDSAGVLPKRPFTAQARLNIYKALRDSLYKVGAKNSADGLRTWYGKRYGSSDYQSAGALREIFVRVVNEDLVPYAAKISVPTLLIWGEHDEDTPLWQGQQLEKTIPDAGLVVLPGAGHYSYLERLGEFVTIVDHFFKH